MGQGLGRDQGLGRLARPKERRVRDAPGRTCGRAPSSPAEPAMTTTAATVHVERRPSLLRRISAELYRRPRIVLGALLTPPLLWLVLIYLGSLLLLLVSSLWRLDPGTATV